MKTSWFKSLAAAAVAAFTFGFAPSAQAGTVTLTQANIFAAGTSSTQYRNVTMTTDDGYKFTGYALIAAHSKETSDKKYCQINTYSSKSTYVQIPAMPGAITNITMTVSNTQQPMGGGGNTKSLSFCAENGGTAIASATGSSKVSINLTGNKLKTGYINASGGVRIWDITVSYVDPVAKIGDTDYYTLQAAADAAKAGDTIELLKTYEVGATEKVSFKDGVTFAAGDYVLTCANGGSIEAAGNVKISGANFSSELLAGKVGTPITLTTDGLIAKGSRLLKIVDGSTVTFSGNGFDLDYNDKGDFMMIENAAEEKNSWNEAGELNHIGNTVIIKDVTDETDGFKAYALYTNANSTNDIVNAACVKTEFINIYGGAINVTGSKLNVDQTINLTGALNIEGGTAKMSYVNVYAGLTGGGYNGGKFTAKNTTVDGADWRMNIGTTRDDAKYYEKGDDPSAVVTLINTTLKSSEINNTATIKMDATSKIVLTPSGEAQFKGAYNGANGVIEVDMTGSTAESVTLIDAAAASNYGTYRFAEGKANCYVLKVVDNDLIAEYKPVAKIGDTNYATLADAVAAAKAGDTITMLDTVTENLTVKAPNADFTTDLASYGIGNVYVGFETATTASETLKITGSACSMDAVYVGQSDLDDAKGVEGWEDRTYKLDIVGTGDTVVDAGSFYVRTTGTLNITNATVYQDYVCQYGAINLTDAKMISSSVNFYITGRESKKAKDKAILTLDNSTLDHSTYELDIGCMGLDYNPGSGLVVLKNGSTLKAQSLLLQPNADGSLGTIALVSSNSTVQVKNGITVGAGDFISMDATSTISCASFTNNGTITVDVTGATGESITLISCSGTADYGTVETIGEGAYAVTKSGNNLVLVKAVAQIGTKYYATINEAFAAVEGQTGDDVTVTILRDITEELTADYAFTKNVTLTTDVEGGVTVDLGFEYGKDTWALEADGGTFVLDENVKVTGLGQLFAGCNPDVGGTVDLYGDVTAQQLWSYRGGVFNVHPTSKVVAAYGDGMVKFRGNSTINVEGAGTDEVQFKVGYLTGDKDGAKTLTLSNTYATAEWLTNEGKGSFTLNLTGAKLALTGKLDFGPDATGAVNMDVSSQISCASFNNKNGTVTVDVTGMTGESLTLITCSGTADYGTLETTGEGAYAITKSGNNLVLVKAVAQVGTKYYATYTEAFAAAQDGGTVKILASVTEKPAKAFELLMKGDVTVTADEPMTATIAPLTLESTIDTDGMAYILSESVEARKTLTIGENVTLVFPESSTAKGAMYVGYSSATPADIVVDGRLEVYLPYVGALSTLTVNPSGSIKSASEDLIVRWGAKVAVDGTDAAWTLEKPQADFGYVDLQGGRVVLTNTFVDAGAWLNMYTRNTGKDSPALELYNTALKMNGALMLKDADCSVKMDSTSTITCGSVDNKGKITVDMTGATAESIKLIGAAAASNYGTYQFAEGKAKGYELKVIGNDLVAEKAPEAKIGDTYYKTLGEAVAAAKTGETVEILVDKTYTLPKSIPLNIAITGAVENVKIDATGTLSGIPNGATFKNLAFTFGNSTYHGFQHAGLITMEDCELNGLFFSYGSMTFKNSTFVQDTEEYCMWVYGGDTVTYDGCTFNVKGKCLNVFREHDNLVKLNVTNCTFNSTVLNKSAINFKETSTDGSTVTVLKTDGILAGCTIGTPEFFPTDKVGGSQLYMIDDLVTGHTASGVKISNDGEPVWPLVAEVNGTKYASLQKAATAATAGDTIKLLQPCTADGVICNKAVTFDINGWDLTVETTFTSVADLTLVNSDTTQGGFDVNGTVTVNGGTLDASALGIGTGGVLPGKKGGIFVQKGATFVMMSAWASYSPNWLAANRPGFLAAQEGGMVKMGSTVYTADVDGTFLTADAVAKTTVTKLDVTYTEGFNTLAGAIAAADQDATVKLLKDVTLDKGLDIGDPEGYAVVRTLDLNQKTITAQYATTKKDFDPAINIYSNAVVTIKGNGTITGWTGAAAAALDGKSVIAVNNAQLYFENGTLTAGGEGSDGMYGVYVCNDGLVRLGVKDEGGPSITTWFAAVGANNLNPGDLGVTVTIYDGTYTQLADGTGKWWHYFCAPVFAPAAGTYTILGGTFNGALYSVSAPYANVAQSIALDGGTFPKPLYASEAKGEGEGTRIIKKGKDVDIAAPEGYAWNKDGYLVKAVAKIGKTYYLTLAEALKGAESGNTIEVLDGTWGADAVGELTTAEAGQVRYKSLTIQPAEGATVKFTAQVYLGYDDSSTANATMTVKNLAFEGASLVLSNYVQAYVEGCTFKDTTNTAGTLIIQDACCQNHKTAGEYPASQITVKDCVIDGSNTGASGIRLRNSGNVSITGCTVKNSQFNGILFESNESIDNTVAKTVTVTGNTITEWNAGNVKEGGRAIRAALGTLASGSTVTIENNVFTKATTGLDTPDFIKITEATDATVSLEKNNWNNELSGTVSGNPAYYTVDGASPKVYETESTKTAVAQIGTLKYETLKDAVAAAKDQDTITLLCDVKDGSGIFVPKTFNKLTFDFNGYTYTVTKDLVGSPGTEYQAFHIEAISCVLYRGTINTTPEAGAKMLVQNYSMLSVSVMTLDGTNLEGEGRYVLSNNTGYPTTIANSTIKAKEGDFAFDTCKYGSYDKPLVVVAELPGGATVIDGNVELAGGDLTLASGGFTEGHGLVIASTGLGDGKIFKAEGFEAAAPEGYYWNDSGYLTPYDAKIGDTYYKTLKDAVAAAQDQDTITLLRDVPNGSGIFVPKTFTRLTFNFDGHTYTVTKDLVGSPGTEYQAFHIEATSCVLYKGTINTTADSGVKMLVQNYSMLSVSAMTLDGTNLAGEGRYVLSNNTGNPTTIANSTIKAKAGDFAFDTCKYGSYDKPLVVVAQMQGGETVIDGNVELAGGDLTLASGGFTEGHGLVVASTGIGDGKIFKAEGFEAAAPEGYAWNKDGYLVEAAAKIGDTYYATLEDAAKAAKDGDTVTLLKDATADGIICNKAVTFDINGQFLTVETTFTSVANLTLKNSDPTQGGFVIKGGVTVYGGILDASQLAIGEGGVITGQTGGVFIQKGATFVMMGAWASYSPNWLAANREGFLGAQEGGMVKMGSTVYTMDGEGTFLTEGAIAKTTVTKAGGAGQVTYLEGFDSLKMAFNEAANEATIKMIHSCGINFESEAYIKVPADKTLTLDLNGMTVNVKAKAFVQSLNQAFIENLGTLTVQDSAGNGVINFTPKAETGCVNTRSLFTNCGDLTIESGAFSNKTAYAMAYVVDNQTNGTLWEPTLTVNDGTLVTAGNAAIRQFANSTTKTGTINVNGGYVEAKNYAVQVRNANTSQNRASVEITGGTFEATDDTYNCSVCCWAQEGEANDAIDITITGGTFNDNIAIASGVHPCITNGVFATKEYTTPSGTTYVLDSYCRKGYVIKGETGPFTPEYDPVALVDGAPYSHLVDALDEVAPGTVLTLQRTTDEKVALPAVDDTMALDKNGFAYDDDNVTTTAKNARVEVTEDEGITTYTVVAIDPDDCVTFTSATPFRLEAVKAWNGTIEWSTNKTDWTVFEGGNIKVTESEGGVYHLYMRGDRKNTIISVSMGGTWWFKAPNGDATLSIACTGNIETLRGAKGDEPSPTPMAASCYLNLFYSSPLTTAPKLPATTLAKNCYKGMFETCQQLETVPELPATNLAQSCYENMFKGCTSIQDVPVLPATKLATQCYCNMFNGCTKLVVNTAVPGLDWKIPATTDPGLAVSMMFTSTGGDVPTTPALNTTYYVKSATCGVKLQEGIYAYKKGEGDYLINGNGDLMDTEELNKLTITNVVIDVEGIGDNLFATRRDLRDVQVSANCTMIGKRAFNKCYNITNVVCQGGVTVGDYAFLRCNSLETLAFGAGTEFGKTPFALMSAIYMKDGMPVVYPIPQVTIAGYTQVLYGTNELKGDQTVWTKITTEEERAQYHFFQVRLEK